MKIKFVLENVKIPNNTFFFVKMKKLHCATKNLLSKLKITFIIKRVKYQLNKKIDTYETFHMNTYDIYKNEHR